MNHIPFTPTAKQRANLERLAAHLDLGVTNLEFDMTSFQRSDGEELRFAHQCGTIGCALGHGPSLGIEALKNEQWYEYGERVFGIIPRRSMKSEDTAAPYRWLFSPLWADVDNTPGGAAARIRYALKHGVPEDYSLQLWGSAPVSYTVPERREHVVAQKETV